MKQELYAILLLITFPILYAGGVFQNTIAASVGIALLVLTALAITVKRKQPKTEKTEEKK